MKLLTGKKGDKMAGDFFKREKGLFFCILGVFILTAALTAPIQAYAGADFSKEEVDYILAKKNITVAIFDDFQPIVYLDERENVYEGLAVDCLNGFSEKTGLKVIYKEADSYQEAVRMVEDGQADLTALVMSYENSPDAYRMIRTEPYLTAQMMVLHNKDMDLGKLSEFDVAEVNGYPSLSNNSKISRLTFDTPADCLLAVRSGHADLMCCDMYTGMADLQEYENRDLSAIPVSVMAEFCFGVSDEAHPVLKNLLEQQISDMSRGDITNSLAHNRQKPVSGLGNFVYYYPFEIICVVLAAAFLAILAFGVYARLKSRRHIARHGYEKSYRLLADALGEAGLSYDYSEDKMTTFGRFAYRLTMPEVIEHFSTYLEKPDREISLKKEEFRQMLQNGMLGESYDAELQCRIWGEGWQHFRFIFSVISTDESYQRPIRMVGCLVNVEEDYQEKLRLQHMGLYDYLTALYNRTGGQEKIEEYQRKDCQHNMDLLLIIDVDHFKIFNDTWGHTCGDDVLASVGDHLKQLFWKDDILCRWGGDEFLLYLAGAAKRMDRIQEKYEALRKRMREYQYEGEHLPVTLSVGGAVMGDQSFAETFAKADKALYTVKKQGRDSMYILRD